MVLFRHFLFREHGPNQIVELLSQFTSLVAGVAVAAEEPHHLALMLLAVLVAVLVVTSQRLSLSLILAQLKLWL